MSASRTHLVLIPSYNPGPAVLRTVRAARAAWSPVMVVVDGSTDGTAALLAAAAAADPHLHILVRPRNGGKGAAIQDGLAWAAAHGFTHALTFDSDGQHPADHIARFMARSAAAPHAMILGVPIFAPGAPALRVQGRRVSNWWAGLETGGRVADSLFGFRVYPIAPLLAILRATRHMRGYDFDAEAAVRLCWSGVEPINLAAPVHYPPRAEAVSHFRYGRDNLRLTRMHVRLVARWLFTVRWRQRASGGQGALPLASPLGCATPDRRTLP